MDRLLPKEYELLMKAVRLKRVDADYRAHQQAFLTHAVRAQKQVGKHRSKPVYTRFRQFYDYEKAVQQALGDDKAIQRLRDIRQIMQKGGE